MWLPAASLRPRALTLKTRLLLTMLALLVLSVSSLFLLHLYAERRLVSQLRDYTEDLSRAIEVVQEQPVAEGQPQQALRDYMDKLGQLGVKDISITDTAAVQASTNPRNVGKRLLRAHKRGPQEWVIRGVLGEEVGPPGAQQTTTLTMPLVLGDRRVGYLLITRHLDDFSALSRSAFMSRLLATLAVFALGIVASLYLSWSFTRPLGELATAARQVASGDLSAHVRAAGGGEIASLSRTFNEMVERLSENRQLEERLHFAERSTALGRLATAIAHEIRNPLNFINLSIDHLRQRLGTEQGRRKQDFERTLASIKAEISRLNRLVGDFLSLGKPVRLDARPCSVADLLGEVAALVEHKANDQGVRLELQLERDLPPAQADPELLKTCFLNLMINAVDAMPRGGRLSAAVRRSGDEELEVEIQDTGAGMTPEQARAAFEPYFSTKDTGVGLGLALTHKIVNDHGGSITLSSQPGCGTTARVVLPLARSVQAKRQEALRT